MPQTRYTLLSDNRDTSRPPMDRRIGVVILVVVVLVTCAAMWDPRESVDSAVVDDARNAKPSRLPPDEYQDREAPVASQPSEDSSAAEPVATTAPSRAAAYQPQKRPFDDVPPPPLEQRCPTWSAAFTNQFRQTCGVWLGLVDKYLANRRWPKAAALGYVCRNEAACHGLGDRMAGVVSALTASIAARRPFRLRWDGLEKLFGSCVLQSSAAASRGDWTDMAWRQAKEPCTFRGVECSRMMAQQCDAAVPIALYNTDRACLPPDICTRLKGVPALDGQPAVNAANVFGCALRAVLEPSPGFLNFKVAFHQGADNVSALRSVAEIQAIFAQYYVIAIHFRVGDLAAFINTATRQDPVYLTEKNPDMLIPFRCAQTLQSHAEGRRLSSAEAVFVNPARGPHASESAVDDQVTVNGKPVRWFVASDSSANRRMAVRVFGARVLMINEAPRHIAMIKDKSNHVLSTTFAEWYALGLADRIIMNRYGVDGVTEGTGGSHWAAKDRLWRGRVSSFPKTAWVYHLKHLIVDAHSCREMDMPIDGTWGRSFDRFRNCSAKTIGYVDARPQPHLQGLPVEFPTAWVSSGRVMQRPSSDD